MQNSSQHDLNHFNSMAQDWWNPEGPCKPLHQLNPIRMTYLQQTLPLKGLMVLDVGCGGGLLSESMARVGAQVTGLELAEEVIEVARNHAKSSGLSIDYVQAPVEEYANSHPQAFDLVTCLELLEHVPDPQSIVTAIAKCLKPGGKVLFSTLNRHPMAFLQAIVGAEYLLKLLPKGTHSYAQFIKPSELDTLLQVAQLSLEQIQGLQYQVFSQSFALSKDVQVNYLCLATKAGSPSHTPAPADL